jgi:16S rRNA (uracil1498-N3)-methyltransferase
MADRFYVNWPLAPGPVLLQGSEAHHLAVVCRLRPGDRVFLFNGDGHEYPADVVAAAKKSVALHVLAVESPARELGHRLEVAAPLPKADRGQFLVEKLTELGVTRFIPLRTRRSVVHPGEVRLDRLQRYVIEASKQCGRNVLMLVDPLREWNEVCREAELPARRWLGSPGASPPPHAPLVDTICAVGPEGGFTDEEVGNAETAGWQLVGLGPRILRIETAALVLAALGAAG